MLPQHDQHQLAERNQRLVYLIANKLFPRQNRDPRVRQAGGWDEVIAEGQLLLVRAARHYQPERGWQFSTYACHCLWHGLSRFVSRHGSFLHVPRSGRESHAAFLDRLRQLPSLLRLSQLERPDTLWAPATEPDPAAVVQQRDQFQRLWQAVQELPPHLRRVIERRYWGEQNYRQQAAQDGVRPQAIQQRHGTALKILRRRLAALAS
jgi:RNA polymerase sigma factor (sigma-70 family)